MPTRPWFFNFSAAAPETVSRKDVLFGGLLGPTGAGAQFGGQVVNFEHNLAFVTVHGSGHMVPTFRPRAALQLIRHVLDNSSFAPPVPDLAQMTETDFDRFVDTWVAAAKSDAFVHP
jgi:cathepsin A (carboxypeptidase C)